MRNRIENTTAFTKLKPYQKNIYSKGKVMKNLSEQFIQANNVGFEVWVKNYRPNNIETEIIKELIQ